jgi:hypothetical protein
LKARKFVFTVLWWLTFSEVFYCTRAFAGYSLVLAFVSMIVLVMREWMQTPGV